MKRLRLLLIAAAMMAAFFITPASALEYTFDSPSTGDFGTPTSAEDIIRERENPNTDKSKNSALPSNGNNTVTVIFADTPPTTGEGSIRKVDADDPTKGLAGAIIKITGVDNNFSGTFMSREGGYLTDIPWDTMPIGSYTAEEMTPPEGYTKSPDQHKVKQTFVWDGKSDVSLIFENDAKVKVRLVKLDDSNNPLAV